MNKNTKELLFLPLGGAGEIGMNLNLYGYGAPGFETWMMVDLGITFGDGSMPGVDVIMPDPAFIEERRDRLAGLVLTHAHEDHLGAVPHLWRRLRCPIYATPFTAAILAHKLKEAGIGQEAEVIIVPLKGKFSVGPFDLELITLTHSIPEPNAIVIRTPVGTILHTGDWKFDPDPVIGEAADEAALRRIGDAGVLAMICDSTNVFSPGDSGSEADLLASLTDLIGARKNRVAVACFASNVARMETIARAAEAVGRDVVLAGRSLQRFDQAARDQGYMTGVRAFLEEEAGFLPKDKTLIICTGSQGEPRAALARIASGDHPRVTMEEGDTVIFSSRIIPGNERSIGRMQNKLIRRGVEVVTERDHFVHVSGHPARDELARMYQHVRPAIAVPVHGEYRHMAEHARLAADCQVKRTIVPENGSVVRLGPGEAGIIDHVQAGRLVLSGNRTVHITSEVVRGRIRAVWHGTAVVTVVVDGHGHIVSDPQLTTVGLLDEDDETVLHGVMDAIRDTVSNLSEIALSDDGMMREAVRIAVRRTFRKTYAMKPVTAVHLVRAP